MAAQQQPLSSTEIESLSERGGTATVSGSRTRGWIQNCKSRATTAKAWEIPNSKSGIAPPGVWTNRDMDPVPPELRTWGYWAWVAYWFSDLITASTWQKSSSIVTLGLSWRQAMSIFAVGSCILAIPMVLNGAIGSRLHVPFPVAVRSSFGYYFSRFAVISRVILAFFWFGIQTWNGGSAMTGMLRAIWPSYNHLHNSMPESAGFTTQEMTSYFLFWVIQFPFLLIHPRKLKWLFLVKAVTVPTVAICTMAWTVHKAGGSGPLFDQHATIHGTEFSHAWLFSLTSVMGGYSTVAVNIPDFTRYSNKPMAQWLQLPMLPFFYVTTSLFGIIATSATKLIWGTYIWSPFGIIAKWDSRAAVFFASLAWAIAQISANVTANTISAANDMTTLFPRYMNIRRGSVVCAIIGGWAVAPWKILASATSFITFLSGYTIVLGPFAGIMVADFWILRRTRVDVPALYNPHGRYRYWHGMNWRALVTLILVVPPNMPGLIESINSHIHVGNINWVYSVSYIFGFFVSIAVYTFLSFMWPPTETLIPESIYPTYDGESSSSTRTTGPLDEVGSESMHSKDKEAEAGAGRTHLPEISHSDLEKA